jgi:hypothetical protein
MTGGPCNTVPGTLLPQHQSPTRIAFGRTQVGSHRMLWRLKSPCLAFLPSHVQLLGMQHECL